jgi:hypothetical protein
MTCALGSMGSESAYRMVNLWFFLSPRSLKTAATLPSLFLIREFLGNSKSVGQTWRSLLDKTNVNHPSAQGFRTSLMGWLTYKLPAFSLFTFPRSLKTAATLPSLFLIHELLGNSKSVDQAWRSLLHNGFVNQPFGHGRPTSADFVKHPTMHLTY